MDKIIYVIKVIEFSKPTSPRICVEYRVYTVRENQGKTYLFRDGQGKSGKVREFNEKVRENLEKVREIFLESSYLR